MIKLRGQRNQCPGCGQYFSRNSTFDRHRIGRFGKDRRCMTVEEMRQDARWRLRQDGFWAFLRKGSTNPFAKG